MIDVTGRFQGEGQDRNAITLDNRQQTGDVNLDAQIDLSGTGASGFHMGTTTVTSIGPDTNANAPAGDGSLTQRGSISVKGDNSAALRIGTQITAPVAATISGSLSNAGTLSVEGTAASAIHLGTAAVIGGDLVNTEAGRIFAKGIGASGILFDDVNIGAELINRGLIQVEGEGAAAIAFATTQVTAVGELLAVENSGRLIAKGQESMGLKLDGGNFRGTPGPGPTNPHIINSGLIQADGTAIYIDTGFGAPGVHLDIHNSGTLIGGTAAVDASAANAALKPVDLTLNNGSQIQGHLLGLSNLNMLGTVQFHGATNIVMVPAQGVMGTAHLGNAQGEGHLSLNQAHTAITGHLNVSDGSSLELNLGEATQANAATLSVTETATFGVDSQIRGQVNALARDFATQGHRYILVQSMGALDAANASIDVHIRAALLNVAHTVDANAITTRVSVKNAREITEMLARHDASTNSTHALVNLAGDGVLAKAPNGDRVLAAFANADERQLAVLAKQLTPEVGGGAAQAATGGQALVANVTGGRTSAVRGMASGDPRLQTGIWAQSLNSDATQGMRDGIDGYSAKSSGMAFGADARLNDRITLGLAYSQLDTDVNSRNGNKTRVEGQAFTLYGGYELGNAFVDGSLTYGLNDNAGKRTVAGSQAKADYDSRLLGLNLTAGYTYQLSPQLLVEPQLSTRYSQVNIDAYREKNSTAALAVDQQRHEAFEVGVGLRVAGSIALGKGTLEPQAKVMALHDFAADQTTSTSTFVLGSTPFVTSGANATRKRFEAGVGADYKLGAVTLGLNYDYVGKSGFNADTVTAKVRYDF